jgi:hypothetical protein
MKERVCFLFKMIRNSWNTTLREIRQQVGSECPRRDRLTSWFSRGRRKCYIVLDGRVQRRASPTSARPAGSRQKRMRELLWTPLTSPSSICEASKLSSQVIMIWMLCDCWRRVCRNTRDPNEDRSLYSAVHAWELIVGVRLITQASLAISQRVFPSFTDPQLFGGDSEVGRSFILR